MEESIHSFKVEGIGGEEINFAHFKDKKIIVVNVASECGFTSQYQQLQELYEAFQDKLVIIGFPCNDFGRQEPGTGEEIQAFCQSRFGVSFPLAAKISIKSNTHPLFQWLCSKEKNGVLDCEIEWNFYKFLINENGHLYNYFPSTTNPADEAVLNWIQS